jgi:hypothetical protein
MPNVSEERVRPGADDTAGVIVQSIERGLCGLLWSRTTGGRVRLSILDGGYEANNLVISWAAFETFVNSSVDWLAQQRLELQATPPTLGQSGDETLLNGVADAAALAG